VGQVREGVPLRLATFVGDGFVASGEAYGLEAEEGPIFFGLSSANWMMRPTCSLLIPLTIVTNRHDFASRFVQIVDRFQLQRRTGCRPRDGRLAALPMPSNCMCMA